MSRGPAIERDPVGAADAVHDLVVIGGGAQGVALALEAARRGLRPVLLERDDFGGGTTWNHLRIVHGGLRYLQTLDLGRFFESVAERRWYLRHFPDLVRPLPCVMPLYGVGLKRPLPMRAALLLNDALSARRNAGVRDDRALPRSRYLSPADTASVFPAVRTDGLRGAARWFDAVAERPERLVMEQLRWACHAGATALNHVEAVGLVTAGGAARGVRAVDRVSGRELTLRAPLVIDAAGPWVGSVRGARNGRLFRPSLAFNLLLRRPPPSDHAVAVSAPGRGARVYFVLPWQGDTLVGTYHAPWPEADPPGEVPPALVAAMIRELRAAVPEWPVGDGDVGRVYAGLLPVEEQGGVDLTHRPAVRFHGQDGGPAGLVSVVGIKFTTARRVAARVLDRAVGPAPRGGARAPRPAPLPVPTRDELLALAGSAPARARDVVRRMALDEAAVSPEDLYLRRADWGRDPEHRPALEELARSVIPGTAARESGPGAGRAPAS